MVLLLRCALLACFAIASGAIYGAAAAEVMAGEPVLGAMFGIPVGIISGIFLVPLLARTQLTLSMPAVFIPTFLVCLAGGLLGPVSMFLGLTTLAVLCNIACHKLKDPRFYPQAGHCLKCHYSLAGLPSNTCPECGASTPVAHTGIGVSAPGPSPNTQ